MKKVIMFPGQGSQYKGMGKTLFQKYKSETKIASDLLNYNIEELCVEDPNRQLIKTQFTQPALYVVNYLQYKEQMQTPDYLIGHSLGEYNALLVAGAFDFEMGLRLVQKRGQLMAVASGGSMAAVLGININELQQKLNEGNYNDVDIANYNTPTQTVLSGKKESINTIIKDFSAQGIRIIPLFVSAPFHSRYMEPAAKEFESFLKDFTFSKLKTPVIANVTARPYENDSIADLLSRQISGSVRWSDTVRYLMGQNVSDYKELGRVILTKMTDDIRKNCTPIIEEKTIPPKEEQQQITKTETAELKTAPVVSKELVKLSAKLGSAAFRNDYGISYSYVAGAMYRGTASKELVVRMSKAGMLAYFGTGGLSLKVIEDNIDSIQSELNADEVFGMNLLHNQNDPGLEMLTVALFLKKGIKNIEAAAYMQMTESLVYFHVSGLEINSDGNIHCKHRILAKVSRPEVAESFMKPAPEKIINDLLEQGKITEEQQELAKRIPVSYDICVEADSGGHTDGGVAMVLLPSIQRLRDDIHEQYKYAKKIRIGLAGGIGTPQSAASAFIMGADFILTGSINQCTVEAGTSSIVKDLLERINVQDTSYAPAGDMFEIGAKVQVLRKGVLFPARANKLYNLYNQYNSLEEIPEKMISQLERNYFKKSISEVWEEISTHLQEQEKIKEIKKAVQNPKYKMALVFRWYFDFSSQLAFEGDEENKVNFQIHTGPALGAFNQWVKGTNLERWQNRHVDEIGKKLMEATAALLRETLIKINQ